MDSLVNLMNRRDSLVPPHWRRFIFDHQAFATVNASRRLARSKFSPSDTDVDAVFDDELRVQSWSLNHNLRAPQSDPENSGDPGSSPEPDAGDADWAPTKRSATQRKKPLRGTERRNLPRGTERRGRAPTHRPFEPGFSRRLTARPPRQDPPEDSADPPRDLERRGRAPRHRLFEPGFSRRLTITVPPRVPEPRPDPVPSTPSRPGRQASRRAPVSSPQRSRIPTNPAAEPGVQVLLPPLPDGFTWVRVSS